MLFQKEGPYWATGANNGLTDLFAVRVSLTLEAFAASARHGSPRGGVKHLAVGIGNTGVDFSARVPTVPGEASQLTWTLGIYSASLWLGRY